MTKKDLVKIIQEVVRIEVKKQVKQIFIKEKKSTSLKSLTEKEFKEPIRKKYKKREKVNYTSNATLNNILNETVGGIQGEKSEYPTLSGGAFDTSKMAELMGYGKSDEVKLDMVAVDTMKKAGVTSEQVPEHVTNALTRDYSDLMKALDKKG